MSINQSVNTNKEETRYTITEIGVQLLETPSFIEIGYESTAHIILLNAYNDEEGRNGNRGISIETLIARYAPLVKRIESGELSNDPRLGIVDESLEGGMKIASYLGKNVKEISEKLLSMGCIAPVMI